MREMSELTNFDNTIVLESIQNSLYCDSWTISHILPMGHSHYFHTHFKANNKKQNIYRYGTQGFTSLEVKINPFSTVTLANFHSALHTKRSHFLLCWQVVAVLVTKLQCLKRRKVTPTPLERLQHRHKFDASNKGHIGAKVGPTTQITKRRLGSKMVVCEVSLRLEKNSLIHRKLLLALTCQIVRSYLWVTNIDIMTSTLENYIYQNIKMVKIISNRFKGVVGKLEK